MYSLRTQIYCYLIRRIIIIEECYFPNQRQYTLKCKNNYHNYLENEAVNNKINPNALKSVALNVNKNNPPEIENTIRKSTKDYKQKNKS